MPARWTPTSSGRVARRDGPGPLVSFLAAAFTLALFTFVLLVALAALLPASFRGEPGRQAVVRAAPSASAPPQATYPAAGADGGLAKGVGEAAPTSAPASAPTWAASPPGAGSPEPSAGPPGQGRSLRLTGASPSVAPTRTLEPVTALITGAPAAVALDGEGQAEVRVEALTALARSPITLAPGRRMMVAVVRMGARGDARYDASHWYLEDTRGKRWKPLIKPPTEPLGSVTVRADGAVSGQVAFSVPMDREISSVVLTDGAGRDLAVFGRAQAAR